MSYLIAKDLAKQIQSENLSQIIGGDTSILTAAELTAIAEAISYLVQKYDTTLEFASMAAWDRTLVYNATNRVYLNATAYSAVTTYALGVLTLSGGERVQMQHRHCSPRSIYDRSLDPTGCSVRYFLCAIPATTLHL